MPLNLTKYVSAQTARQSSERVNEGSAGITVDTLVVNMGAPYRAGAFMSEGDDDLPIATHPDSWPGCQARAHRMSF